MLNNSWNNIVNNTNSWWIIDYKNLTCEGYTKMNLPTATGTFLIYYTIGIYFLKR